MRSLVRGFLGAPGSGKTYLMSVMASEWRRHNPELPIFSTYELRLPGVYSVDPPGDSWGRVVNILDAHDGLLLLDEVALQLDSRLYQKTPIDLLHKLMQCRKYRLELWWSTQYIEYVDKRLRLLTMETYYVGSFANLPVVGGFFATVRNRVHGSMCGWRYIRRTSGRDNLYDSWGVVRRAGYYGGESGRGGGKTLPLPVEGSRIEA